jgi:hypothetical protein
VPDGRACVQRCFWRQRFKVEVEAGAHEGWSCIGGGAGYVPAVKRGDAPQRHEHVVSASLQHTLLAIVRLLELVLRSERRAAARTRRSTRARVCARWCCRTRVPPLAHAGCRVRVLL